MLPGGVHMVGCTLMGYLWGPLCILSCLGTDLLEMGC